ncbi:MULTISPECIES: archaeoflavoprotein AfpA [unclassified Methanosarcina]|uniref:archaeoflavoprotein AfpA n=1 Tax=unclassified Methanosarcina TaxID=2644672 RepID=UPI00061609CD|nr:MULTISPECIES: archaeoflavoprotein AfpA [unclassified Methanosarcina]AKB17807.1 bifunctional phosphopantothenoylcysteine decarboxylase/phosphopantothenate synthase [Methanosarcina sp. WWM596]AKB21156.1 bifunctional phosphopantothenoylcysteine decarboxylase/phosphopantothenate synthase [Methanosarcina sp. WH1]
MVEPLGKKIKRIAWGITGSGDQMIETYSILVDIKNRTGVETMVFLSKEGETVIKWYHLWDKIQNDFPNFKVDAGPNSPFIAGPLQMGYYDFLLIAPATANTVAKIVYGIADTLVTNAVSQTAKGKTPIFILPVDQKRGTVKTAAPSGRAFELSMREVDVTNSEKLAQMENITVLPSPYDIYDIFGLERPSEDITLKIKEQKKRKTRKETGN